MRCKFQERSVKILGINRMEIIHQKFGGFAINESYAVSSNLKQNGLLFDVWITPLPPIIVFKYSYREMIVLGSHYTINSFLQ